MKGARNPKRTSSQYSCTKTFVNPESGSFTTVRRVRTRDHYHQQQHRFHTTVITAANHTEEAIDSGFVKEETTELAHVDHQPQNGRAIQVSEYRGGDADIVFLPEPLRIILHRSHAERHNRETSTNPSSDPNGDRQIHRNVHSNFSNIFTGRTCSKLSETKHSRA